MDWPARSQPVALILEPDRDAEKALGRSGYRQFGSVEGLWEYLERLWDKGEAAS